jgi:hypothetical protein
MFKDSSQGVIFFFVAFPPWIYYWLVMSQRIDHGKLNRRMAPKFYAGAPYARLPKPRFKEDPATDKQIDYLQLLLAKHGRPALDKIDALKLSRSEASRQINELKPRPALVQK